MNVKRILAITALVAMPLLVQPKAARAEPMQVEPGQWSFTSTTQQPMGGAPKTSTNVECIREESMTPQKFLADMKGCTVSDASSTATSMQWKMNCPTPMGAMTGKGSIQSTGTTVSGSLSMTMNVGQQKFPVENDWTGRRLGDCP